MGLIRVTVLSLLALATPALAEDAAPQQCWMPAALAATH